MPEKGAAVTQDALRHAAKAEPFVPFKLHLINGRFLEVDRPDQLHVAPFPISQVAFGFGDGTYQILNIRDVLAIEIENGQP